MNPVAQPAPADPLWKWIAAHQAKFLGGAVLFQVAVLLLLIAQSARPWLTGTTVRLRVVPVDPRDLFRGDYLILTYDFTNQLPPGTNREFFSRAGDEIFVSVEPVEDGKHWRTASLGWSQPQSGVFLRGHAWGHPGNEFGIEKYFVQEGHGRHYEKIIREKRLWAEVAVTRDGKAALERLIIEDN